MRKRGVRVAVNGRVTTHFFPFPLGEWAAGRSLRTENVDFGYVSYAAAASTDVETQILEKRPQTERYKIFKYPLTVI